MLRAAIHGQYFYSSTLTNCLSGVACDTYMIISRVLFGPLAELWTTKSGLVSHVVQENTHGVMAGETPTPPQSEFTIITYCIVYICIEICF